MNLVISHEWGSLVGTGQTHLQFLTLTHRINCIHELQYMAHLLVTNSFSLGNKAHSKGSWDPLTGGYTQDKRRK